MFFAGVVLPALSNHLRWAGGRGGVPGGGIEPGTAVQQSSALSTKPRRNLLSTPHPTKSRRTL